MYRIMAELFPKVLNGEPLGLAEIHLEIHNPNNWKSHMSNILHRDIVYL